MAEKIAFITGGNRGIGFQTALDLGSLPEIKVVIGSRLLAQGQEAVSKLRNAGVQAEVLEFDVVNPAHHKAAHDYFQAKYGRLDILVNNAGVAAGKFPGIGPEHNAADVPMETLRRVFETNFFAQVAVTEALLPLIRKSAAGRIVNLSSILGSLTFHADPKISHLPRQILLLRRVQVGAKRLHHPPCLRTARHEDQGELRASRLGKDGHGRRSGNHGPDRRLQDQRHPGNLTR